MARIRGYSNGSSPQPEPSPRRRHLESQRLQLDLEKAFENLRVRDAEVQKLHAYQRKLHSDASDLKESALAKEHAIALAEAQKKRDAVRQEAEAVLQRHLEREAEERRQKEMEEQLRLQREAVKEAERQAALRAEQERLKREEEQRKRAEEDRQRAQAEKERQEKQRVEDAERARKQQEDEARQRENDRRAKEAADKAVEFQQKRKAEQEAASALAKEAESKFTDSETVHAEYISLYLKIKKWKNDYWEGIRQAAKDQRNPAIKDTISEARRTVKGEISKIGPGEKEGNRIAQRKLKEMILNLLQNPTPVIGTRIPVNFFLPPSLKLNDNDKTTITDQGAYILCWLTQTVVKHLTGYIQEENSQHAEPVGVLVTSIFAQKELQFQRVGDDLPQDQQYQSLFPIFLAKYHRVCPALFGITASQSTPAGKNKMGWALEPAEDDGPKTNLVSESQHTSRMIGLAIGYASFALRNFSGTALRNPYPATHFWKSMAQILNLPSNQVQVTHVYVLRYMLGYGGIQRFLMFFGAVGVAMLREAFVFFPARLPPELQAAASSLHVYAENLGESTGENLHLV